MLVTSQIHVEWPSARRMIQHTLDGWLAPDMHSCSIPNCDASKDVSFCTITTAPERKVDGQWPLWGEPSGQWSHQLTGASLHLFQQSLALAHMRGGSNGSSEAAMPMVWKAKLLPPAAHQQKLLRKLRFVGRNKFLRVTSILFVLKDSRLCFHSAWVWCVDADKERSRRTMKRKLWWQT